MAIQTGVDADDGIDRQLREEYYRGSRDLEEQLTTDITEIIRQFLDRRFEEGRRPALRDAHAQDTGCVRAVFRVDADLDQSLRQGIFQPGPRVRRLDWILKRQFRGLEQPVAGSEIVGRNY